MIENKITIIINKPVNDVFEFTTNPKNTHLWIPSIVEEIASEFPPQIGTEYKNRGDSLEWDLYSVLEFENNKIFTLAKADGNYFVKYLYNELGPNQTEMEYHEWVKKGELENPFTKEIIQGLKNILEE